MSEELVKQEEVSIVKFEQFNNVNEMLKYAQLLIDSGLTALKKPEQVVLAANLGRALGVSFDVATQNIYNIQGKPTLSVHLITALALKAGIAWEVVEDAVTLFNEEKKPVDKRTTIKFYRFNPKINKVIENTISYTYSQAQAAGYVTKDNWKTKLVNMLRARCLTEGIRFVASDVLMGVFYETGEMMDANNQTYDIDDEGNVILNK